MNRLDDPRSFSEIVNAEYMKIDPGRDLVGKPREPYTDEVFFVLTVPIGLSDYEFACGPMDSIISGILLEYFGAVGGQFKATKARTELAKERTAQ